MQQIKKKSITFNLSLLLQNFIENKTAVYHVVPGFTYKWPLKKKTSVFMIK